MLSIVITVFSNHSMQQRAYKRHRQELRSVSYQLALLYSQNKKSHLVPSNWQLLLPLRTHLQKNGLVIRLPDLTNKNAEYLVKLEFPTNNNFFSVSPKYLMGDTNILFVYLKFQFNWTSCILSANPSKCIVNK